MSQTVLTFISPVDPARVDALTSVLATIAADLYTNPYIPFPSLPSLHFASLVVLPRTDRYGPFLVFENNFDGQLDSYLDELVGRTGNGLHAILQHTQDYPRDRPFDAATLRTYLRAHVVRPNAYHVGAVGRSVARIKQESELRKTLEAWLDELVRRGEAGAAPAALHARIQQFVAAQAAWARTAPPRQTGAEFLLPRLRLGGVVLLALALLPGLLPLGLAWLAILHWKEKHDAVQPAPPNQEHVGALLENENRTRVVQNHMASITLVKPGAFRRATLRLTLWVVNLVARCINNGELSGIPSIHFAHWSLIDRDRRLLFLSNFDGSWDNYLDDFIDKAARSLTAIWSNTVGFPRTSFLICGGARDGTRFKAIARDKQVFSNVWYSAYRDLTVVSINRNSTVREDLFRPLGPQEVRRWLWRL